MLQQALCTLRRALSSERALGSVWASLSAEPWSFNPGPIILTPELGLHFPQQDFVRGWTSKLLVGSLVCFVCPAKDLFFVWRFQDEEHFKQPKACLDLVFFGQIFQILKWNEPCTFSHAFSKPKPSLLRFHRKQQQETVLHFFESIVHDHILHLRQPGIEPGSHRWQLVHWASVQGLRTAYVS